VFVKPEERIRSYLFNNKKSVEYSTMDLVILDVKMLVFGNKPPISDEEIRKVIADWAVVNAVGLLVRSPVTGPLGTQGPSAAPPKPPAPDSELINSVKKVITLATEGVTVGKEGGNVNLSASGLTGKMKGSNGEVGLNLSFTGTLKLEAKKGPVHFEGKLSSDSWSLQLSYPQDTYIPDLSTLGEVFAKGEEAVRVMATEASKFQKISDARAIAARVKPHSAALDSAVEAVGGLMNAPKKGGASFGFSIGSPAPEPGQQGMPKGYQAGVVFTYVF
jgi:hypothetical protein